ncbi:hypothetical protein SAMN05216324_106172 [Chryseobacterium limigenitum]|uniref:Uncharacterized protein n=1 Tax=Chryseobacterium limigenitum TaxID=1612149 RepID=A0A1K2IRB5_9FLAO|nr:hypothetical protein SAMN05216324_106172 [Chryseobacterium limigenitum]
MVTIKVNKEISDEMDNVIQVNDSMRFRLVVLLFSIP